MWRGAVLVASLLVVSAAAGLEFREDPYRVGINEVGDPVLLTYEQLTHEMDVNGDLRTWINEYGRPDYAEVQRIEMDEPFFPYEVRLYYLDGNRYVVFGRVHVAPTVTDYGTRKYLGRLDAAQIRRLLTAQPMAAPSEGVAYDTAPPASSPNTEIFAETEAAAPVDVAAMPGEVEIIAAPPTSVESVPATAADVELGEVPEPAAAD
jgi:hypothetical protein